MGSRKVSILSLSGATLLTPELDSGNTIQARTDMLRTRNSVCFVNSLLACACPQRFFSGASAPNRSSAGCGTSGTAAAPQRLGIVCCNVEDNRISCCEEA